MLDLCEIYSIKPWDKWKETTTGPIKNFLSYKISKSGRKETKKCSSLKRLPNKIQKLKPNNFLNLTGNMMTSLHPIDINDAWIHIYMSYSFRICNKNGGPRALWRDTADSKLPCFWHILYTNTDSMRARIFNFDALVRARTRAHAP